MPLHPFGQRRRKYAADQRIFGEIFIISPATHRPVYIEGRSQPQMYSETLHLVSDDIIYRTVSYIASHFAEEISLTQMAEDLGYSPYVLSRVFSGTFHCNFNTYLNHVRLDHACNALLHTDQTITEVYENAGFTSQRTFNRVFREKFRMSPKDYRKHTKYTALRFLFYFHVTISKTRRSILHAFTFEKLCNGHALWMFHIQTQKIFITGEDNIHIRHDGCI